MTTWEQIDDLIVTRHIIRSLQIIREVEGCDLRQALELFNDRYEVLRGTRPDDFTVPPEEYGQGVYT